MKSVKGLSILVLALLLQGCLPDSFTKFEEEPAVKAEGGTSGDEVNICNTDPGDAFCATPARIEYSPVSYTYNIDNATLDSDILIEPRIFSDGEYEGLNEYMTFTIQPPLPASTGLRFDTDSGNITGKPLGFYHKTQHTVSAIFTGNEPLTEGEIIAGTIELSIATPLSFLMNIQNPVDQKVVLDVNDITPFSGITESDNKYIATEKENGSAKITYVDEATNQVVVDPNTVGSNNYYVLRTENSLALDITNDNSSSFANERASTTIGTIALSRVDTASVSYANALSAFDVAGKQVSALKFDPTGAETSLTDNERYSIKYDISPDVSPYGLNFAQYSKCYSKQTLPAPVNGTEVDTSSWSPLTLGFDSSTDLSSFSPGDQVISSRGVIATINSVSNGSNKQLVVATATDERVFASGFVSPYDPPLATSFSKENALIVRSVVDECSKDPANPSYVSIPGGTIWGQIDDTKSLLPSTFTITATNAHNSQSIREFNLSILSPRVPKGISDLAYRQQENVKLKIEVDNTTAFKVGDKVSTEEGKTAQVIGLNRDTNQLFLEVNNFGTPTVLLDGETVNKDDLFFENTGFIDNAENFFVAEAVISGTPVFLYTEQVINDGAGQPFIKNMITPDLFEDDANIAETRSLAFEITPDVTLLGSDINFQEQSACFDTAGGSSDTTLWTAEADFTNCDPSAPTAGYMEIRGGTIWGSFDPDALPLNETEFSVTARTLTGTEATASFKLEATPAVEPPELSYTQDFLLKVIDVTNFQEGDYFSISAGSYGIVKQVVDVDADNRFLWVQLIDGSAGLEKEQGIDNKRIYKNQRGYVTQVHPVNALFITRNGSIAGVPNVIADEDEETNIITNGAGAQARVVYQNTTDLFVRVTEGAFTTGETLYEEDGTTSLTVQIENINAQNLTLNIQSVSGALPADSQITDSEIVYHDDALGTDYTGVASIRSKSGTSMDVEMIKDRLGDFDYEATHLIYFDNPHDGTSVNAQIASISTNAQRYTFYKNRPLFILPSVEPTSSVASFEITPDLPEGVNMDVNTGVISGVPADRSDFIEYTVTASGFQDKEYTFKLEIKDYFGLVNQTPAASTYILHKAGMGNGRTPCSITRDQWGQASTKNRDIGCYLEAGEKELYSGGIDLDLVFGKDMCQFVKHSPYHVAIREAGETNNPAGTQEVHLGDADACGGDSTNTLEALQDECVFDHTSETGFENYNCDGGVFDYDETTYTQDSLCECSGTSEGTCTEQGETYDNNTCGNCMPGGVYDSAITSESECGSADWDAGTENLVCSTETQTLQYECGGSVSTCVEGAGTDILSKEALFQLSSLEQNVQDLDKVTYSYNQPETKGFMSNRYLANFLQVSSEASCTTGDYQLDYAEIEDLMQSRADSAITTSTITQALTGRPFYTYECLDGAGETIARIRLMVRDWDKSFRASSEIDKVNPNTGTIMDDTGNDAFGNPSNEFVDNQPDSLAGSCGAGGTLDILDNFDAPAWPHEVDATTLPCDQGECFF